jgi:hypothetical protein
MRNRIGEPADMRRFAGSLFRLVNQGYLRRFDAVWRIVPGVVCQFGNAITIHVLGVGVQPGRVNGVAHIDASLG